MFDISSLEEFKALYREHYHVRLNDDEAFRRADNLLNLYKAVYGLPPFEEIPGTMLERDGPRIDRNGKSKSSSA